MFSWVIALVVIAIVAAIFGGVAAGAVGIAQIIFWAALILVIVGFVVNRTRR